MKICKLNSELKFINRIGATLSTQERISLTNCCQKLQCQYPQFDIFNFWGRIQGIARNYYIIEAVKIKGVTEFPISKYFWSNDDFKFAQMPEPRWEFYEPIKAINEFFTGQHQKIIIKTADNARHLNALSGEMIVKQKNVTQLDRLVIIIHAITRDCNVVPLGAYKMIPTHQLVENPDFKGLKMHESKKIESYLHLRLPENSQKKILIQSDKALQRFDFLDCIGNDDIKNCWSLQADESSTEVTIRNLYWLGYVGYHRINSKVFGGAYMGSGIPVYDLPFLL